MRGLKQRVLGSIAVAVAASAALFAAAQEQTLVVGRAVMPDGSLRENVAVTIRDGRIVRVSDGASVRDGATVLRHPDAVLSPGLIALDSSLGVPDLGEERRTVIDADFSPAAGWAGRSPALARALAEGITAVMVTPRPNNVVSGVTSTVRTWSSTGAADVLKQDGSLSVVLSSSAYSAAREPSSRAGAMSMLRRLLVSAREGGSDVPARLREVAAGRLPVLVRCEVGADVAAAVSLLGPYKVPATIVHTQDMRDAVEHLKGSGMMGVVGPYSFEMGDVMLSGARQLAEAGVDLAFSGAAASDDPGSIRRSAWLAVRAGLDAVAARRALTTIASRVAGVADRVGSIAEGKEADLVLFSGDPLRPDARVMEVWVAGQRVYAASSHAHHEDKVIGATHED